MKGQRTIYDEGVDNIQEKINKLQKNIDRLTRENDGYKKDRDDTRKHLEGAQWHDISEDEKDIRFYDGAIETNEKQIKADLDEIAMLKADLQDMMNLKHPKQER